MTDDISTDEIGEVEIPSRADFIEGVAEKLSAGRGSEEPAEEVIEEVEEEVEEAPAEPMITIKVDGEEQQVTQAYVIEQGIRAAQKESAADRRLRIASEKEKEIRAREQQLMQYAQQVQQQASTTAAPEAKERAKKLIEGIFEGDEDAAIEAAANFLGTPQAIPDTPRINPDDIAAQVLRSVDLKQAIGAFDEQYADITSDPILRGLANEFSGQLLDTHPEYTPSQNLTEAGKLTHDWMQQRGMRMAEEGESLRVAAKQRAVGNKPRTAHGRSIKPREAPPPTRSDIVAQMRKARGQL